MTVLSVENHMRRAKSLIKKGRVNDAKILYEQLLENNQSSRNPTRQFVRESRNSKGELTFFNKKKSLEMIKNKIVIDLKSNQKKKLFELGLIN